MIYMADSVIIFLHRPIPDSDPHSPALMDLLISSDPSICYTVAFPPAETLLMLSQFLSTFFET